jgi:hypothetical protein
MIAAPLLTTAMNSAGILGGFLAETVISGMLFAFYVNAAFSVINFVDYIPPMLKTVVFGLIVGTVSSSLGYNATGGRGGCESDHAVARSRWRCYRLQAGEAAGLRLSGRLSAVPGWFRRRIARLASGVT